VNINYLCKSVGLPHVVGRKQSQTAVGP